MPKGQQRSNREHKKPKQPKAPPPVRVSPGAAGEAKPISPSPSKKK